MSTATQPRTNGYITARVDDLAEVVVQYRRNEAAVRRLQSRVTTRNHAANTRAIARRTADRFTVEASVAFGSDRAKRVVGNLIAERDLLVRLAQAAELEQERPELHQRLAAVRADIRFELSWSHR